MFNQLAKLDNPVTYFNGPDGNPDLTFSETAIEEMHKIAEKNNKSFKLVSMYIKSRLLQAKRDDKLFNAMVDVISALGITMEEYLAQSGIDYHPLLSPPPK